MAAAATSQEPPEHGRPMRLGWAKLLKRFFNLDLTQCQRWGGDLRIVAAIVKRQAIEKILNHLEFDPQPPPRAPARRQMALLKRQVGADVSGAFELVCTVFRQKYESKPWSK
jgi:hypothetical protein